MTNPQHFVSLRQQVPFSASELAELFDRATTADRSRSVLVVAIAGLQEAVLDGESDE